MLHYIRISRVCFIVEAETLVDIHQHRYTKNAFCLIELLHTVWSIMIELAAVVLTLYKYGVLFLLDWKLFCWIWRARMVFLTVGPLLVRSISWPEMPPMTEAKRQPWLNYIQKLLNGGSCYA